MTTGQTDRPSQSGRRKRQVKRDDKGRRSILATLADDWAIEPEKLLQVVRSQCFPMKIKVGDPNKTYQWKDFTATDDQVMALLIIAVEHRLNPLLGELAPRIAYGQVKPVIPIDGWIKLANEHPQYDGLLTEYIYPDNRSLPLGKDEMPIGCTCTIYRKDRGHPTVVTEWFWECYRKTEPWDQHPRRMIRHKAIAQCARIAFGFAFQDAEELAEDADFEVVKPLALAAAPSVVNLQVGPDSIGELKEKNAATEAPAGNAPPENASPNEADRVHPVARANQHASMRAQINKWLDQLCGEDDLARMNALERWSGIEKAQGPSADSLPDELVQPAWAKAAKEWTENIGKRAPQALPKPLELEPVTVTQPKRTKRQKVAA